MRTIVESLIEKTKAEEANWRTSSTEGEYSLYLNNSTITIGTIHTFSDTSFVMRIYNDGGDVVTILDSSTDMDSELKSQIEELYSLAHETFLHTKKTIESVIEELKKPGVVGSDTDSKELPF